MSGKEALSLEEFATAPRKPRTPGNLSRSEAGRPTGTEDAPEPVAKEDGEKKETSTEARRALRQMKRARMKGASHFVNVNLDRDTKRRLKLASFTAETSMQDIMEKAIRQYLDTNGF
ncbi:hypothetical protein RB623_19715 [Mesorhizobium sp. LHD-90]|uniref:hypothetical protein n=1 Tax=Mesorhizobium sp. LHD-90 TaxID=3071414 RepID=UPI0027E1560A|nr:hypothetical protein [Mesorhizobium sp. LHD-90]MDQ6436292.1 hypothetical protein [Mesorhizobium sp. LHD-90]